MITYRNKSATTVIGQFNVSFHNGIMWRRVFPLRIVHCLVERPVQVVVVVLFVVEFHQFARVVSFLDNCICIGTRVCVGAYFESEFVVVIRKKVKV